MDDTTAEVATAAKVVVLVQLFKVAIRGPDGIHPVVESRGYGYVRGFV